MRMAHGPRLATVQDADLADHRRSVARASGSGGPDRSTRDVSSRVARREGHGERNATDLGWLSEALARATFHTASWMAPISFIVGFAALAVYAIAGVMDAPIR
jgi:hypothetical protein